MVDDGRDPIQSSAAGTDVVPYEDIREGETFEPESDAEAQSEGPDAEWKFWRDQLRSGLVHERRWRLEAIDCEELYFGEDKDPGPGGATEAANTITDKTALIHGNIDVLKPLLFSETPQPIVRRRFRGDGRTDETDIMAAEAGQRIATYLIDTTSFDDVMESVRDDWLIAGRGAARVIYSAEFGQVEITLPDGSVQALEVKTSEDVKPSHIEWRRLVLAPAHSWEPLPWMAFEIPMSRSQMRRFDHDPEQPVSAQISYNHQGLIATDMGVKPDENDPANTITKDTETGQKPTSPFDVCMVWEIWNRDTGEIIWWSEGYTEGVLDRETDPMALEGFWPMPKPLLSTTKGQQMTPRPDIKYYERRAKEIDLASNKLHTILKAVSVSGLFPGQMQEEIKKLLDGDNVMIPVESWIKLMESGGTNNVIQWLPLQHMISAIQALVSLRDQAKYAMFEASGVSDIMRAQGDPNETATAQQIKGRYAGMRLAERQRKMGTYVRDFLRLMVEIALEHFDSSYLADICGLDIPATEAERQQMMAEQEALKVQYQQLMQAHQAMQQAVSAGLMEGPVPPAPEPPELDRIAETSFELVHERLRTDYGRKISVTIETDSTILSDEQADKEARIEFLSAFSKFVAELGPLAARGAFDYKTIKELLLFGIRGFPKSRTLEGLIASLPDEPQGEAPEDPSVTVAKIRGEVDKMVKGMDNQDNERQRQHERQLKGVDMIADAATMAGDAASAPPPQAISQQ